MTANQCRNCKHFHKDEPVGSLYEPNIIKFDPDNAWGYCELAEIIAGEYKVAGKLAYATSPGTYPSHEEYGRLRVSQEFGCVQFEEILRTYYAKNTLPG